MAPYKSEKKIGRNAPCPCGSGKKFKYCHGSFKKNNMIEDDKKIPKEVMQRIIEIQAKEQARKSAHGEGRPIISTEFKDYRIVAVGNELHYAKKEKSKYFPDFLGDYIRAKFGSEWGNSEIAKPLDQRHQLLKWYDSMCHFQSNQKPESDGTYKSAGNGSMLSWYRLAYDLYLIKHNAELQDKILSRLRNKDQFQGARFELCATATMITSGFEIKFEDESDISIKHAEFLATHSSGLQIAVEAKSRHRDGVLDYKAPPRRSGKTETVKVSVENLIRKALDKKPNSPYFIFIDVNLPYTDEAPHGCPWFQEMAETVDALQKEWGETPFPSNAIYFCNDPSYQDPEVVPEGNSFWCYVVPIKNPAHKLPDENIILHVANAATKITNIPNEYPDD